MQTVVQQHPDQFSAEVDGDVLMMHTDTGEYFGLNSVASFIWHQVSEPRPIADICRAIQEEFDVDESRCVADTREFLQQMINDGLLVEVESTSSASGS